MLVRLTLCLLFPAVALAAPKTFPQKVRQPQYPLKDARCIRTDAELAQARQNIAAYPAAKRVADTIVAAADSWLAWDDTELRGLIATADVPRAFNVGTNGCPTCGKAIYEKGGTYPWLLDLKNPFKVTCPVCNGVFPGNDYASYYRGGFQDEQFMRGEYADDGWGWVGPDGHRYWFVAYANHWTMHDHVIPAIGVLAQAYQITGDARYAHKTALLLDRVAEVYPAMDYHNQSRYGQLQAANGGHYGGKIVNLIWATGNLTTMATAYDAVWETIDANAALQSLTGKSGEQIRANIEANLLEEGIDAIFAEEIRGNFGMHQRALVAATLARQHGKTDEWLDGLLNRTGCSSLYTGLNYALYNLVYRDGVPYETAPGYNSIWVNAIASIAESMKKTGRDLYALPKTRRLFDGVMDVICAGAFTPSVGDSGGVDGGRVFPAGTFQDAWRAYQDPRWLAFLKQEGATGEGVFGGFDSLFHAPIEAGGAEVQPAESRLLDGYGMGILNNAADSIALALYYGYRGGHGHFDRLNFEMFAHGVPIMPDLGYPDFMNGYVPGIYTWSKATVSHNTVVVDASRQAENQAGTVRLFADSPFARVVDVDAPETYPQCSEYRRHIVMIDAGPEASYFVDFFTVRGGSRHDYSLHSAPGVWEVTGGEWTPQEKGTYAGEEVEIGALYDDPVRSEPGYAGTYYDYRGSGFQHLSGVQRHNGGDWLLDCAHARKPDARLRMRLLPEPGMNVTLAEAQVSPVKQKQHVKFVLATHAGENVSSRFVSVLEPYSGEPTIAGVRRIDLDSGATAVVAARANGGTDIVLFNPTGAEAQLAEQGVRTDALSAVVSIDANGAVTRVFFAGGETLAVKDREYRAKPLTGRVIALAPERRELRVRLDVAPGGLDPTTLAGRVVHFGNGLRRTSHPVEEASFDGEELVLRTRDELLIGRANVTGIEPDALVTNTAFLFAPVYRGTYVSDAGFAGSYPLNGVDDRAGKLALAGPLPEGHGFAAGQDAWIVNVGPGDRFEAPAVYCGE